MKTPARYQNAKWEDVPARIQKALKEMVEGGKGIYLHGGVGTGKTHICYAIWAKSNRFIRMWNVVDLMHEIRSDFDRHAYDKRRPEEVLTDPDDQHILILDDIGAERVTDFAAETLYRIVNHRYVNKLPTIFTSNCTPQELAERVGERTTSRIVEMCDVYELGGKDRRLGL